MSVRRSVRNSGGGRQLDGVVKGSRRISSIVLPSCLPALPVFKHAKDQVQASPDDHGAPIGQIVDGSAAGS